MILFADTIIQMKRWWKKLVLSLTASSRGIETEDHMFRMRAREEKPCRLIWVFIRLGLGLQSARVVAEMGALLMYAFVGVCMVWVRT